MTRPVLDVTAGTRAMWFDKADQRALFGDARTESITVTDRTRGRQDGTRTLNIAPDVQLDFRALPFASESFRLVVFDPPHLTRAGAKSWLAALPARAVGLTIAHRPQLIPLLIHARLLADWQHTRKAIR